MLTDWEQQNITHMMRLSRNSISDTYCGQPKKMTEPDADGMYLMCPDCIRIAEERANAD